MELGYDSLLKALLKFLHILTRKSKLFHIFVDVNLSAKFSYCETQNTKRETLNQVFTHPFVSQL